MKKILVLGSGGMAGHVITLGLRQQPEKYLVLDISRKPNEINPKLILDVSEFEKLSFIIRNEKPDIIINCVGILNKQAEENPEQSILINSYLPHFLEAITKGTSQKIIHISTDCVFAGSKGSYSENDFKDGKGYYAQSKALGELNNTKDLTFRTSIIGPELKRGSIGLLDWFLNQHGSIQGYNQAFWSGVTTIELMRAIKVAIDNSITGLYHLVNNDKISKFDLLILFKEIFEKDQIHIEKSNSYFVDKSLINNRSDLNFKVGTYKDMVIGMKIWMKDHEYLYKKYNMDIK